MATGSNTGLATAASGSADCTITRHAEVARLVALARDLLCGYDEQIVGDYLGHALGGLDHVRESALAERS